MNSDSPDQPIEVKGPCGNTYNFKPEFQGALLQCPKCHVVYRVPQKQSASKLSSLQKYLVKKDGGLVADTVDYSNNEKIWAGKFRMSQVGWVNNETYKIFEENESQPISFAERFHYHTNLLIYLFLALCLFGYFSFFKFVIVNNIEFHLVVGWSLAGLWTVLFLTRVKFCKRNAVFWNSADRVAPQFYIKDKNRSEFPNAIFEVEDLEGNLIGSFMKSWFSEIYRNHWTVSDGKGLEVLRAHEESIVLSLLRRLFFNKLFWFRANFILFNPTTGKTLGEFNREWSLRDNYTLDMSLNTVAIDPRLLLAFCVLLDSAERR